MNKQPQQGEWWRTRSGEIRLVFGVNPFDKKYTAWTTNADGTVCCHCPSGAEFSSGRESPCDLVEHLPDCDSFDWQPTQCPRYFETHNREDYAFLRQDSATDFVLVRYNGTGDEVTVVDLANRDGLTEAEAMSRIVPPKPKTRTITFCEYIVWDEPGCERLVWALRSDYMLYRYRYPTGLTRTIEVPID
jgi:hypothetical protein